MIVGDTNFFILSAQKIPIFRGYNKFFVGVNKIIQVFVVFFSTKCRFNKNKNPEIQRKLEI